MESTITPRQTKYCDAIRKAIATLRHATNLELLEALRMTYPDLSATTVHRLTARLVERGELQFAPPTTDGAMRFDVNTTKHDHFMCRHCGKLRDATFPDTTLRDIEGQFEGCTISGPITISGICKNCTGSHYA